MSSKEPTVIIALEKYKPNEEYNNMIRELLQIEEKLDHFRLTTHERRQFQNYVEDRINEIWLEESIIGESDGGERVNR